ncbi:hypothetical protein DXG01_002520 [Tephrocybe rancida]|nr:hypothetical protein DXG01_002520 [Tephrocybe rancida]
MVRLAGASTRNRNRQLSNKFRLKVVHGDVEADPVDVADEDGEKSQYTNLVAGVDAEDANVSPQAPPAVAEHHLQEVLHASGSRGAQSNGHNAPQAPAFIPTPDSTGIVEHYTDLYPPTRWKDPVTYLYTSVTPEESCNNGLASSFTYYMDERDKEWLDKNNEVARGEGTSAQGALATPNSATRTSGRSSKAKGKEPEISLTLPISEDEFELVMGLFEKVTHEKTEYLHHALETGMAFPSFSEYQDTFLSPLPAATFTLYSVPQWIPAPSHLVRIARVVYEHWKERRIERGGHRIIPILNYDEADTLNESYVCFRRREIKTVRKTRASQATSSDKLVRLQTELSYPLELGKHLFQREHFKQEAAQYTRHVWEKRILLAEFKRKYPNWGDKADDDLLVDKEQPKRTELPRPPKIKPEVVLGTPIRHEVTAMRPTERTALINDSVEKILTRQKDQSHNWEDQIGDPYQMSLVPYPTRCFKYIPNKSSPAVGRVRRAVRTRVGRGGRLIVDRRDFITPSIAHARRSLLPETEDAEILVEDDELLQRLQERWRYDADDVPAIGPEGHDETDRVLVDDYSPRLLRHSMMLLSEPDQQSLTNDPTIAVINDGRPQFVIPFRLGLPPVRRLPPGVARPGALQGYPRVSPTSLMPNGTPISVQQQLKKMPPPVSMPQMRISSNGGMRTASAPSMQGSPLPLQSSPPNSTTVPHHTPTSNGIHRAAINLPHIDASSKGEASGFQTGLNGVAHLQQPSQLDPNRQQDPNPGAVLFPTQPSGMAINVAPNGFHTTTAQSAFPNSPQLGLNGNHGLSALQMQNLKTAFANAQAQANQESKGAARAAYLSTGSANYNLQQQLAAVANSNFNLKIPPARPMQWTSGVPLPTKSPVSNGADGQMTGSMSPPSMQAVPIRAPSTNGIRPGMRVGSNGQHSTHMSPHTQHNALPISATLVQQSQSPPRIPLTPTLPKASPLLQHQQPTGGSKSGY